MFKVTFTATVFNPDTEEVFNGWVDLDWNRYELRTEQEDVRAKEFDTRAEALEFIESQIGSVREEGDNIYAEDSDTNLESGEDWSYAGYIEEI